MFGELFDFLGVKKIILGGMSLHDLSPHALVGCVGDVYHRLGLMQKNGTPKYEIRFSRRTYPDVISRDRILPLTNYQKD